jgi:hypothetical protein
MSETKLSLIAIYEKAYAEGCVDTVKVIRLRMADMPGVPITAILTVVETVANENCAKAVAAYEEAFLRIMV